MSRLPKLPLNEWSGELRAVMNPESATELQRGLMRFFAHAPEVAKSVAKFGGRLRLTLTLPERMVELVRLRVAYYNQCRRCMAIRYQDALADGVTEDLVWESEMPQSSGDLTDAKKVVIRFADTFATNHLAVTDKTYDELEQLSSEIDVVVLGVTVAFSVGLGRLAETLDVVEELAERIEDKSLEQLTPWNEQ